MKNHYEQLVAVLGVEKKRPVSSILQLPIILAEVSVSVFDQMLFESYGIKLNEAEQKWFAVDGKELRGSIEKGCKRGEAIGLRTVSHEDLPGVSSGEKDYYAGEKESEVTIVRKLLQDNGLASRKTISLDALHCKVATLEIITQEGGKYLVGLKENQKQLKKQSVWQPKIRVVC